MTKLVTIDEAKINLRLDTDEEDARIQMMILSAESWVEAYTGVLLTDESPDVLRQAVLVLVTGFYNDREGGDVMAKSRACAESLCWLHRVVTI